MEPGGKLPKTQYTSTVCAFYKNCQVGCKSQNHQYKDLLLFLNLHHVEKHLVHSTHCLLRFCILEDKLIVALVSDLCDLASVAKIVKRGVLKFPIPLRI